MGAGLALAHQRLNPDWILSGSRIRRLYSRAPRCRRFTRADGRYPGRQTGRTNPSIADYIFWFGTHPGQTLPAQVATAPMKSE